MARAHLRERAVLPLRETGRARTRGSTRLETLVFRIAQEALNNVVKHSGQREANLTARRHADRFELEIADNGRGFDTGKVFSPAGDAAGLGLRGIRDRVEMFSGQFSVESTAGRGSRLRIVVPLTEGDR